MEQVSTSRMRRGTSTHSNDSRSSNGKAQRRKVRNRRKKARQGYGKVWIFITIMALFVLVDAYFLYTWLDGSERGAEGIRGAARNDTVPHLAREERPPQPEEESESYDDDDVRDRLPILEILRQAGMDPDQDLDRETILSLPKWSQVVRMIGDQPRILGLDRCEEFRSSTDPTIRFFGMAGTFNTGTNLISELMIKNCQISERMVAHGETSKGVRWQVPWGKHYPAFRRGQHVTKTDKEVPVENSLPLVVARDPYQWAQSMCRHTYAANWRHNKQHCPNIIPTAEDKVAFPILANESTVPVNIRYAKDFKTSHKSLFHFWNEWYQLYYNATYPRIMVRFEDLLFYGKEVTETLCACGGGVPREDRPDFEHISESAKLGTAAHGKNKTNLLGALVKYGTDIHKLDHMTKDDLSAAKQILDPTLMDSFHYSHTSMAHT